MSKLLFISGDTALAQGKKGPFYYLLEEFSKYWERVDIICPRIPRTPNFEHPTKIFDNVYIHSSQKSLIFQPWFILKKGKEIYQKEKFDVFGIHSYPPFYNDIGGRLLYRAIKVPYVLEIMHINGCPRASGFKEWFYKILTKLFVGFFARKSAAVRVINYKQVPEFLIKSGVDKEKIKIVPAFYIDFDIFKPQEMDKSCTKTSSVQSKKYDIVFSGRLVKNKGIYLLLEAVKQIKNSQPMAGQPWAENIKLIIIGDGPLKTKIEKYIKKNNLQSNVEFSGWLSGNEDVAKVYNQSKVMVVPSFNEGGPRVALEAMACKTPVLTSRVGIMLDVIKDNENGIFIDWNVKDIAKKITLLLKDENLRKKIAENGYDSVQQFERIKSIKNYAEAYQNLLHSAGL